MKRTLISLVAACPILLMSTAPAWADYSAAIMSFNPVGYWPLNETNAPPYAHLATNSGTLGPLGDAYYGNDYYPNGNNYTLQNLFMGPVAGPTSDGVQAAQFNGGTNNDDNSQYLIVPDMNHDLDNVPTPFTAEAWVKPEGGDPNDLTGTSFASTEWAGIVKKGGGGSYYTENGAGGNTYGWTISLAGVYVLGPGNWGWLENGSGVPAFLQTNAVWVVDFYGGNNGNQPCLEFDVPMNEPTPQWYHLVLTYDGTTANFYTNGVLAATTQPNLPQSTNNVISPGQLPWTTTGGNYAFSSAYVPDTANPLCIGNINESYSLIGQGYPALSEIGFNCQNFNGAVADVAVYTNALSAATVLQHYQDATASNTTLYTNDVLSVKPPVFFRFNEPAYTEPAFSAFPIATNYGSMSGLNGLYQPGVVPDVPGEAVSGFGSNTNAVQMNGLDAAVDVGNGQLAGSELDPTNLEAFSAVCWFKGNPADCYGRFQTFLGRGDNGWRFDMDNSGDIHFNPGQGPEINTPGSFNDGAWHQAVGVSDGHNAYLYIDGQLSVSAGPVHVLAGTPLDLLIGGAPDYTTSANNNSQQRYFAGQVSQVAFFTNALNGAQVEALYADATNLAPVITAVSPTNLVVGATLSGSVTAYASGQPVTYQWYQGATKLSNVPGNIYGVTNATLTFSNAVTGNEGSYSVVVANGYGSASAAATVTVLTNVEFTSDISNTNITLFAGGHCGFSIGALGKPPVTYQWYSNNVAIAGATATSYELTNAQPANTTNGYYCVGNNSFGSTTSSVAQVIIIPDPTASYPVSVLAANPVGFWRLNEGPDNGSGDAGVLSHDYWGGNNGIYTNVTIAQQGYNIDGEPNETSVEFSQIYSFQNSDVFAIPTNVDFSAANGVTSDFSIEAWVKGVYASQTTDAGLVSKGYGGGGEEFDMDCGNDATNSANPYMHSYRFFVRDASGATHGISSEVNPNDNLWHHLVGVCNESQGYVAFYIDGQSVGTAGIGTNAGILTSDRSILIGSRPSSASTNNNDDQFSGNIDDVAVYNYALTGAAVSNQFVSADIPAFIAVQPTNATVGQNGTVTFSAIAAGTPVISYQWYANGVAITGATSPTLVLTNVQGSASYYLIVANAYGGAQSVTVSLQVVSGAPQIFVNLQPLYYVLEGDTIQIPATVYGTLPLGYQWQYSPTNAVVWTSLTDNGSTIGSQSNVLTIADAQFSRAGLYQLVITNVYGAVTSSVANLIVGAMPITFNGSGLGWSGIQSGTTFTTTPEISTNGLLTLTDGQGNEARSFFFLSPVYVGAFDASFTYRDVNGTPGSGADGASFCLQNDPRGPAALGGGGGSLGVSGITPSVELELNLYTGNSEHVGYTVLTDGLTGANGGNGNYFVPGNVVIDNGHPINVNIYYVNGQADVSFTDAVNGTNFSTSYSVNIPAVVGGETAYVGFTGADGGVASTQVITNFTFVSLASESIQAVGTNALISWSQFIPYYNLQSSSNLLNPVWVNVTNAPVTINGTFQVTVPAGKGAKFYRLVAP